MKNRKIAIFGIGLLALIGLSNEAQAYPMFARQTGMDCMACHMQHIPKLNSMGRQFMISGMTMSSKSFDANSSQIDINPSLMFKSSFEETWDKPNKEGTLTTQAPTAGGRWSIPKTASLLVGGRLSEHFGTILDLSYKDIEHTTFQGQVVYAKSIQDGYMGTVLYSTASFGPFTGMEVYNTGLNKPLRTFDLKKLANAFQASGIGTGAATGVQVYFDRNSVFGGKGHLFGTIGIFTPGQDNTNVRMINNILPFARLAYEYPIGGFNLMLGGFMINGGSKVTATEPRSIDQDSYGLDFQLEGYLLGKSVSLVMSKVLKNQVTYTGIGSNAVNPERYTNLDNKAFSVEGEVNVIQSVGLKAAYLTFDDLSGYTAPNKGPGYVAGHIDARDIADAYTIGVDYSFKIYLPMKLTVEHSWAKPKLSRISDYRTFLVSLNILY